MPARTINGQPILCSACSAPASTRHQIDGCPICRLCWRCLTAEGRRRNADAVRRSRAKKAAPAEEV